MLMTQRLFSSSFAVRRALVAAAMLATFAATGRRAAAIDTTDTRMLSQPALSARQIAFIYAGDLYVCDLDGHNVRRLTSDEGIERSPAFSPDGTQLAFSAEYDGNVDVYVVPVAGGVPRRLTWHPGADVVQGFTPDGTQVLFTSPRAVFTGRYTQLFTVPVKGGVEVALPIPNASRGSYNADGTPHRLQPAQPGAPAVEALPRRFGGHDHPLRPEDARHREDRPARDARQRRRPAVARRPAVLPVRS